MQRLSALAVASHFMSIKCGGDVGRCTRNFQQDGTNSSASDGGRVGRTEQDQALRGGQVKGERDEQRDRHCGRQARGGAEDQSADGTAQQQQE